MDWLRQDFFCCIDPLLLRRPVRICLSNGLSLSLSLCFCLSSFCFSSFLFCLSPFLSVSLFLYVSLRFFLCLSLSFFLSLSLSFSSSLCLFFLFPCISLFVHLSMSVCHLPSVQHSLPPSLLKCFFYTLSRLAHCAKRIISKL